MKQVIKMTMNSCRDRAEFAKQTSTKRASLHTKGNKPEAIMVMCSRSHLPNNEE